jgi:hypothetical protein
MPRRRLENLPTVKDKSVEANFRSLVRWANHLDTASDMRFHDDGRVIQFRFMWNDGAPSLDLYRQNGQDWTLVGRVDLSLPV